MPYFRKGRSSYLPTGRLADVLSLLQTLGLHPYQTHRDEDQLRRELCGAPRSCGSWKELAQRHPEFFRVSSDKPSAMAFPVGHVAHVDDDPQYPISLIARHQGKRTLKIETDDLLKIPPVDPQLLKSLMDLAVDMHDQEEKRKTKWFPLVGQVTAAMLALAGIVVGGVFFRTPDIRAACDQRIAQPAFGPHVVVSRSR